MRCFAAIVLLLMPLAAVALDAGEKETIHTAVVRQADAWNAHDARAYAALFSDDCDVVNVRRLVVARAGGARSQARDGLHAGVSRQPARVHRRDDARARARRRARACALDDERRENAARHAGAEGGHPDIDARAAKRSMADQRIPEHAQHPGARVSRRTAFAARRSLTNVDTAGISDTTTIATTISDRLSLTHGMLPNR